VTGPKERPERPITHEEEPPPILGRWGRIYALVLLSLLVEIVLFYIVTRTFS
jgi:hypothetical protein